VLKTKLYTRSRRACSANILAKHPQRFDDSIRTVARQALALYEGCTTQQYLQNEDILHHQRRKRHCKTEAQLLHTIFDNIAAHSPESQSIR
jgi:hypothetical protein